MSRLTSISSSVLVIASCAVLGTPALAADTAKASVTVDGATYAFSGGSCVKNGRGLTVNIGVPSMQAPPGTHPDYFGMSIVSVPGSFSDAIVSFIKDGKRYSVGHATGTATAAGATFSGTLTRGGAHVTGSFTC